VDIVLGVSMTPTTVRMVLVEGENADGVTVDHDAFDVEATDGSATSNAADQVVAAVLGTQESAAASGHHLKSIGVTWTHHSDAAALRDTLTARGIEDVMLVSATHAASSLAQAVGRAIGYDTTALLFIEKDTATLSVVQTEDGSVVKVLSRDLHDSDAMAVLTEMAKSVESAESPPQGLFIMGSGVDAAAVKAHLENLVALPVSAPDEPALALARGAALASAHAPEMEASTAGLAYSQDRDGTTAASAHPELAAAVTQMAGVPTQMAPVDAAEAQAYSDALAYSDEIDEVEVPEPETFYEDESRKPFLLVGSALTSIFVVGVVALVISLAVSIRPTVDQRPSPGGTPVIPSQAAPAPVPELAPVAPAPAPAAPPPEIIKAPVPVVQQAPAQAPRTVFVEKPAPVQAAIPAPLPAAPPPAPLPAAPVPVPAAPVVPPVLAPPIYNPPVYLPQRPPVWIPPWQRPSQSPPWQPPWNPPQQIPDDPPQQYPGSGSGGYPGSGGPGSGSGQYPGSGGPGSGGGYPDSGSCRSGSGGDYDGGGSGGHGRGGPSICVLGICTGGH
jgi:hypothetical protein